jgi:hypothetical protein
LIVPFTEKVVVAVSCPQENKNRSGSKPEKYRFMYYDLKE